ncbi:hypothetical protein [Spirulina sp. CCNP1310]|uniref:NACHT C-terminal alpha/beta 1 domain-containing protein n=1 Tax=Spirulina sp. CCNP1310 TaxID=3110249 RepID=UPI003A4C5956
MRRHIKTLKHAPLPPPQRHPLRRRNIFHPDKTHPRTHHPLPTTHRHHSHSIPHRPTPRSPLKGFPPNQPNLISAIETWLEEL